MQRQESPHRPEDNITPAIKISNLSELALLIASDPNVIQDFKRPAR